MSRKSVLAVEPNYQLFDDHGLEKLRALLLQQDGDTIHSDISSYEDVMLNPDGSLHGDNLRFTTLALAQLCQRVCPGLTRLAFIVSGLALSDRDDMTPSVASAVRIINETIRARFNAIDGMQLVRNVANGTIEGITGAGYQYLSNHQCLERVLDVLPSSSRDDLIFKEGELVGRKLSLIFVSQSAVRISDHAGASLESQWIPTFVSGFRVQNAETGDCSVRSSRIITLQEEPTPFGLRLPRVFRVVHSGRNFESKLNSMLHRTFLEDLDSVLIDRGIGKQLGRLAGQSLGFGKLSEDDHKQRLEKFVSILGHYRLSRSMALRTMQVALYSKAHTSVSKADYVLNKWTERSALHLLIALMQLSRQVSDHSREFIERAVCELLHGHFSVEVIK